MRISNILVLAVCLFWSGMAASGDSLGVLPMLTDLRGDSIQAQREEKPIVLFFSLPGCPYCHVVRQHYLVPLLRDRKTREQPIIREVDITDTQRVTGFDGATLDQRTVAKGFNIRVAPTVIFLDAKGQLLTQPIVGGDIAGLYGAYLDNALDEAEKKIAAARQNTTRRGEP